jgi:hypothetical protein
MKGRKRGGTNRVAFQEPEFGVGNRVIVHIGIGMGSFSDAEISKYYS